MEKTYKLEKPRIEYHIYEKDSINGDDFRVLKIITFKGGTKDYELAQFKTYIEAYDWLHDYLGKLDKELEEENWNEIKESYTGFEGDR